MNYITNQSFGVVVLSNQENVDYKILSKDKKSGVITFALSFRDISKISTGNDPDILEMHLNKQIAIDTTNRIIIYKKGLKTKRSIPPLI
jgi:chemotaxis protein CheY-P-specific phosphatase CheC